MVEWLEHHHEWVAILAIWWVGWCLYKRVKVKVDAKRRQKTNLEGVELPGDGSEMSNLPTYGGGSGGGAGSSRSFASPSNSNVAGAMNVNPNSVVQAAILTDNTNRDLLTETVTEGLTKASEDYTLEVFSEVTSAVAEVAVETATEIAGEIVAGVIKD